jgi:RNA polymerase sigma-70 factor (ECF subfamily)
LNIYVETLPEGMWTDERRADAFEEMYRRCYPQLVDLCRRTLSGRGDAEAVAQEAFVRAWVSLDRFSGARPFWPWVATIARRLCIDNRRRFERETTTLQVEAGASEQAPLGPDEVLELDEEHRSVLAALQRLKPSEQRVITLREVNGWSYDEIAQFEGVTTESIRGALKRARVSLRKSYAKVAAGATGMLGARFNSLRGKLVRTTHGLHRVSGIGALSYPDLVVGTLTAVLVATSGGSAVAGRGAPAAVGAGSPALTNVFSPRPDLPVSHDADEGRSAAEVAPAPSKSDAPVAAAPAVPLLPLLPGDGATVPEDAVFTSMTASPSYDHDGTIFATGTVAQGCAYGPCAVVFRSTDRGASWARLPATGFTGGSVLLSPSYPQDPRIFVAGREALLVSNDWGATFTPQTIIGGPAAVSPAFATDHRILFGQAPGWEYRDDLGAMSPSGIVLPSTAVTTVPAFSPDFRTSGVIYIGGAAVDGGGSQRATIFRCVGSLCESSGSLSGVVGVPSLVVGRVRSGLVAVFAWRGNSLFRSLDEGRTFSQVRLPIDASVRSVAVDAKGRVLVALREVVKGGSFGGVVVSADAGDTWSVVSHGSRLDRGAEHVVALPDGRLVAAVGGTVGGGVECSTDNGRSWRPRCER